MRPTAHRSIVLLLALVSTTDSATSPTCASLGGLAPPRDFCGLTFHQFIDYDAIYGTGGTLCYRVRPCVHMLAMYARPAPFSNPLALSLSRLLALGMHRLLGSAICMLTVAFTSPVFL